MAKIVNIESVPRTQTIKKDLGNWITHLLAGCESLITGGRGSPWYSGF